MVRAAELLYAVDARDRLNALMADIGDKSDDVGLLVMLSELAAKYEDPRGMLLVGKLALGRGHALDHPAFPTVGLPKYTAIGPEVEPALVYSIARQESWFNPKTVSSANAMGYMQVTPAAGKYLAKKFNVTYDQKRLLNDNVYNLQMGAAELGDVIKDYRGSYILAFVGLQRRPRPGARLDRPLRRSARSQGRPDRLGGAHSVLRDPQLRAARHGKRAGLSRAVRRRLAAPDRGRPAARRQR